MLEIPEWAYKFIKDKECPYCGEFLADCILLQVGLKLRDESDITQGCCLCFEARCASCKRMASTTILTDHNFDAAQIVTEIYNAIVQKSNRNNNKNKKNNSKISQCKIQEKELNDLIKFMKQNDDYDSFLKYIGITDWEIRKYKK